MEQARGEIVAWVAREVLPHEADVRRWLRRQVPDPAQVDDIVQEAYCRLAELAGVGHIGSGRAYFFMTVRHIAIDQMRRARIVRIDAAADLDALGLHDEGPSPERVVAAREELRRVQALIAGLPDKCRRIFILRRLQGVPQREIARRLGLSENTVESQAVRGLKLILSRLAETEPPPEDAERERVAPAAHRQERSRVR